MSNVYLCDNHLGKLKHRLTYLDTMIECNRKRDGRLVGIDAALSSRMLTERDFLQVEISVLHDYLIS